MPQGSSSHRRARSEEKMSQHYTIVCDSHDRETWLGHRATGIGASEIAPILGASSWGSPLTVYLGKVNPPPKQDDEEWMLWGLLLEPAIRAELGKRAGVEYNLDMSGKMLRSIEHPWATATPDEMTVDGEPVEVKKLSWGYVEEEWEIGIPEKYRLQCQHQMLVTGARRCLFGALIHGDKLIWEWVDRDEATIRRIVIAGAEMWRRIQEHDEPPSDGHERDRAELARRATEAETVELYRDEADEKLALYWSARSVRLEHERQAKEAKKLEDAAANNLAQLMGTATRGVLIDGTVVEWRETTRKGFTVAPSVVRSLKVLEPKEDMR